MSGRTGKAGDMPKDSDRTPKPTAPPEIPDDDDEEDGDIATPKRDRDDEAAGS